MPSEGSAGMTNGELTGEGSATSSHLICMIIVPVLIRHSRAHTITAESEQCV